MNDIHIHKEKLTALIYNNHTFLKIVRNSLKKKSSILALVFISRK